MIINFNKKIIFSIIIFLFIGISFRVNCLSEEMNAELTSNNFSHMVFVGIATAQNCKPCDTWNENIYDFYISGEYDFEYVEMIEFDHNGQILNQKANDWSNSFDVGSYPTSIFDRNFQRIIGNNPEELTESIEICGDRLVNEISATMNLYWLEDGKIQIDIMIENNEEIGYNGHIRAFITEIISRYDTYYGNPYHFGFLDYAYDKSISINPGATYSESVVWDGNEHEDEHGDHFGDIYPENIQVSLVIYNNEDGYLDETVNARVNGNNPPDAPVILGETNGKTNKEYEYRFVTTDFNNNKIFYFIDWDDGNVEDWIGPFESGEELIKNHTWTEDGTYNIKAKAKDTNGEESPWTILEIKMPFVKESAYFLIIKLLEDMKGVIPILKQIIWSIINL